MPILYHDDCVNSEGRISTGASVDRFLAPLGESDAIVNLEKHGERFQKF